MLSCYASLDERGWGMGELGGAESLTPTLNNLFSWFLVCQTSRNLVITFLAVYVEQFGLVSN